jgi:hypothetical protein
MKKFAIALSLVLLFAVPVTAQQVQDDFFVTVSTGTVLEGGGSGFAGGEWYEYPSLWINQWFYDHPFTDTRGKIIHIEFDWRTWDTTCVSDITVAVNWSTPEWSYLGFEDSLPPLPGWDEALYIERVTFLDQCRTQIGWEHVILDYVIWEYNPEWVSIDVRGCNFEIANGVIVHECAIGTEERSWGAIKEQFK